MEAFSTPAFLDKLLGSFLYRCLCEKPQTYISANAFFNLKDLSFLMMKPELQLNSHFLRSLELQQIQNRKHIKHLMLIFLVV